MQLSIDQSTLLCRLLADASRQRILLLLEAEALSVAEITQITRLSQGRVSTHLSRLRAAGLVTDERVNNVRHFRANLGDPEDPATGLWQTLRARIDDQQAEFDREKAREAVRRRHAVWVEVVVASLLHSHVSFLGHLAGAAAGALWALAPGSRLAAAVSSTARAQSPASRSTPRFRGGGRVGGGASREFVPVD